LDVADVLPVSFFEDFEKTEPNVIEMARGPHTHAYAILCRYGH